MLFFNSKKNLWAGRELATDNSFILLWLHCRLFHFVLCSTEGTDIIFNTFFSGGNFSVMCAFLSAMAILTPKYSFVGKDNKKFTP